MNRDSGQPAQSADVTDAPYLLDARPVYLWFKYPYQLFRATLDTRLLRASVSCGLGLGEFAVGLLIATLSGFATLYLTSPAVYLLAGGFAFFMGRAEWLWLEMFELIKHVREVFLVSDEEFKLHTTVLGRQISRRGVTLPVTVVSILLAWGAIAIVFYAPANPLGTSLAHLEPASFPRAWFVGPHEIGKMLILDWYFVVGIFFTVNVAFGTIATMVGIPGLVAKWSLVPIPAYVSARMARGITYLLTGAVYYAFAVFLLVLFFGNQPSPLSVGIVSGFVGIGLLVAVTPYLVIGRLVDRAVIQVSSAVSETYRREVFPLASGRGATNFEGSDRQRTRALARLLRLQEVMQATNNSSGTQRQFVALVPAVFAQGLPYLGLLASDLLRQLTGT